ncbi:glycosyltransferase [Pelagibacteraceae bacterium]|nr:glycosyltransferase [Pelagibacteraceae bacterium]
MFSVVIATYNKLDYLKICLKGLKNNSNFNHQIIIHVNEGTDGTLEYVKKNGYEFSYSHKNEGVCISYNKAAKLVKNEYLVIMQDDMYFCPNWDIVFLNRIKEIKHKNFFLSGTMIQPFKSYIHLDCGKDYYEFNEVKLLKEYSSIHYDDFQGTHWQPSLLPIETWNSVNGFSEEFSPGVGCDPDLNMKLWKKGVRIFQGLGNCRAYHFSSMTLRKSNNLNKGAKTFLLKWGFTIKFFKKFYLRSDTKYLGELVDPKKKIEYYLSLVICKFKYFYYKVLG